MDVPPDQSNDRLKRTLQWHRFDSVRIFSSLCPKIDYIYNMDLDEQQQDSGNMGYQLRVRISTQQRDVIEKLRSEKFKGETLSDIVRMALSLLMESQHDVPNSILEKKVVALATLLKREPNQIEQACIEGILYLIENKAAVPLIVMESHLHLSYGKHEEVREYPWES